MIKVDQYQLIRELYAVKGLSQREIARTLGISEYFASSDPSFRSWLSHPLALD